MLLANQRQWLGLGRRWKGGKQDPPHPQPVVIVGRDESDESALNALSATVPGFGNHSVCAIQARGADVFVERIESNAPSLRIIIEPLDAFVLSPASGGILRKPAPLTPPTGPGGTTLGHAGDVPLDTAQYVTQSGSQTFAAPGLLVASGQQLRTTHTTAATDLIIGFWFREAL